MAALKKKEEVTTPTHQGRSAESPGKVENGPPEEGVAKGLGLLAKKRNPPGLLGPGLDPGLLAKKKNPHKTQHHQGQ